MVLAVFLIDCESKALVDFFIQPSHLAPHMFPYGGIAVFHDFFGIDFCINNVANYGAAWGMFGSLQIALLIVRIAVVSCLIGYMVFSPKAAPYYSPLALVVAGAIGNIADYFIYGHVVDMFHFIFWGYTYPVFNVADSAIFCGIAWIVVKSFLDKRHAVTQAQ